MSTKGMIFGTYTFKEKKARDKKLRAYAEKYHLMSDAGIGKVFGISRQRVYDILHGIDRHKRTNERHKEASLSHS